MSYPDATRTIKLTPRRTNGASKIVDIMIALRTINLSDGSNVYQ